MYRPPQDYFPFDTKTLCHHLAQIDAVATYLSTPSETWRAEEVGDGNLNLVFIIKSEKKSLIAKQALPYVRLVGESWPLPLSRAYFEHEALCRHNDITPHLTPAILHYDHEKALIIMEHLTPHIILRKGLISGVQYPLLADHMGHFLAESLFNTSDLALDGQTKKMSVALFSENHVMSGLTEQVIFDDPYFDAELNRHTSPELDDFVNNIRSDNALKKAIQELKTIFMNKPESLLHGDLHTGSVMVTQEDTRIIDPEFAFYGPMGFDIGAFMTNLLLSYFSQKGHEEKQGARDAYGEWLLETVLKTYAIFEAEFSILWRERRLGSLYPETLFENDNKVACEQALTSYLRSIMVDALGFTGAKMIRRILGIAHVEDLETIENQTLRATCEKRALDLARILILDRKSINGFDDVVRMAREINS